MSLLPFPLPLALTVSFHFSFHVFRMRSSHFVTSRSTRILAISRFLLVREFEHSARYHQTINWTYSNKLPLFATFLHKKNHSIFIDVNVWSPSISKRVLPINRRLRRDRKKSSIGIFLSFPPVPWLCIYLVVFLPSHVVAPNKDSVFCVLSSLSPPDPAVSSYSTHWKISIYIWNCHYSSSLFRRFLFEFQFELNHL